MKTPDKKRHVLAALRSAVGLTQSELARLLRCSISTIKYVELGRLKLSESLAERINREIGAPIDWLLENDANAPLLSSDGEPYSRRHYEIRQAALRSPKTDPEDLEHMQKNFLAAVMNLRDLFVSAQRGGKFGLVVYQLDEAFRSINSEFLREFKYDFTSLTPAETNAEFEHLNGKFNEPFVDALAEIVQPLAWQFAFESARQTGKKEVVMKGLGGRTLRIHLKGGKDT